MYPSCTHDEIEIQALRTLRTLAKCSRRQKNVKQF